MTVGKDIRIIFGAVVKELRLQKGLTQEKLAEYLGVQTQTITRIETARSFVSSELLAQFCDFFNVEPSVFFNNRAKNYSSDDFDFISKIKRLLPNFKTAKLEEIYNILIALQK